MYFLYGILFACFLTDSHQPQQKEIAIVHELYRLRNAHKADSAELLFADTVRAYMKYMRNVPRRKITEADRQFWKAHPRNRFEITGPVQIKVIKGVTMAIFTGKEYLDGTTFNKERIEIGFDQNRKIISLRGFNIR